MSEAWKVLGDSCVIGVFLSSSVAVSKLQNGLALDAVVCKSCDFTASWVVRVSGLRCIMTLAQE